MVKHIRWNDVETEKLNPLLDRQYFTTGALTVARILLRKGMVVPRHSHDNEQVSYILEGALKFTLDDREVVVASGEVLVIPPNVPHQAEALEDTIDLDVFYPPRADWIAGTDDYLRGPRS